MFQKTVTIRLVSLTCVFDKAPVITYCTRSQENNPHTVSTTRFLDRNSYSCHLFAWSL